MTERDLADLALNHMDQLQADLAAARQTIAIQRTALEQAAARESALETLCAGYRAHLAALVQRVRARQMADPRAAADRTLALVERRDREGRAIRAAHAHDAWALRILTGGECCAAAPRPADLPPAVAVARPKAVAVAEVGHA